jgi:arylsulfatase
MRKGTYNLYYCVSDNLEGPYDERKFAGRFLGHGTPFKDKQGRWWCTAFYNANHPTLTREEAQRKDVSQSAYTLNKQGLTLVPIDIKMVGDKVVVRTLDPDYASPGAEEVQKF